MAYSWRCISNIIILTSAAPTAPETITIAEKHPADMSPEEFVAELDKHIVGHHDAKRAVAVAMRSYFTILFIVLLFTYHDLCQVIAGDADNFPNIWLLKSSPEIF